MTVTEQSATRLLARTLAVTALSMAATGAAAGTIVVTHFHDVIDNNDGTCTLREAVRTANADTAIDNCSIAGAAGEEIIVLSAGTYAVDLATGTAEDASADGDLDVVSPLEIRGIAPDYTVIDGNADTSRERVFDIGSDIAVKLRDLTVTGGHEPAGDGGNIRSQASVGMAVGLTLDSVVVSNGRAVRGGGIFALGRTDARRVLVTGNEAVGTDGGGGGIAFGGLSLILRQSAIENNRAASGGGLYGFGGASWVVSDSRVKGNVAVAGAGAQSGRGGGIASLSGSIRVLRTLIEGNEAEISGGGVWLAVAGDQVTHSAIVGNTAAADGGGVYSTADNFIRHSTVTANVATSGGGIHAASPTQFLIDAVTLAGNEGGGGLFNQSGAFLEGSLVAANAGGNCLGDPPAAGAYNLDDGNDCGFPASDPDLPNLVNTDPLLGPLQDNGGGLPTLALQDGSPAIDAVSSTVRMNCQNTPDQRGYPRGWPPVPAAGQDPEFLCDIGAFERHAAYVVDTPADTQDELLEDGVCADATGACSLRAAIMTANTVPGLEEIELAADTYAITLAGANEDKGETGDLDVTDVIVIRGQGADQTVINAAQLDRALHVVAPMMAAKFPLTPAFYTISDLSIENGAADEGGAILAKRPLRVERAVLRNNSAATGDGGALLCVTGCELRITDSTLAANAAAVGHGGAIYHGSDGFLDLERSTLSGNSAGIGGAIEVTGSLRALNSTFSNNTAGSSGAFFAGRAVLESSTVFSNEADGDTGAFYLLQPSIVHNSIVANNLVDGDRDNCSFNPGGVVSAGSNLADTDSSDCNFTHATDLIETNPLLDALADNDAAVQTHALTPESPAVDAGGARGCPAMDQRGLPRPSDGDNDGTAGCDIGAFELQPQGNPDPDPPDPPPPGNDGGGGAWGWSFLLVLLACCRGFDCRSSPASLLAGVTARGDDRWRYRRQCRQRRIRPFALDQEAARPPPVTGGTRRRAIAGSAV